MIREVTLHYDRNADPKAARPIRAIRSDEAISWDMTTKSGEKAMITFVQWNNGSYWTDATSGGALAKLYWDTDTQ